MFLTRTRYGHFHQFLFYFVIQPNRFQNSLAASACPICFKFWWLEYHDGFPNDSATAVGRRVLMRPVAPTANELFLSQLGYGLLFCWTTVQPVRFPLSLLTSRNSRSPLRRKGLHCKQNIISTWKSDMILTTSLLLVSIQEIVDGTLDLWVIVYFATATSHLVLIVVLVVLSARWYRKRTIWGWFQIQLNVSLIPLSSVYFLQGKLVVSWCI